VISDVCALKRQFFTAHVVASIDPVDKISTLLRTPVQIKGSWIYIPSAAVPGRIRGCKIKLKASVDDAGKIKRDIFYGVHKKREGPLPETPRHVNEWLKNF